MKTAGAAILLAATLAAALPIRPANGSTILTRRR